MVELGTRQVQRMVRNAEHVHRTADAFKERAQEQNIDLAVHRPPHPLESQFDVAALKQRIATHLAARKHLSNPDFTVDQLAEAVALSRRQCTRRLKEAVDMTPAKFIRHRRIEHAQTLLQTDPETIAEVVYAVGFRSPSHFSKIFREASGQSPSAYRDAHASSEDADGHAA